MIYISLQFYIFLAISLIFYYIFPLKKRWIILLISDIIFYLLFYKTGKKVFLLTILISYIIARLLPLLKGRFKKALFIIGIVVLIIPWFISKDRIFVTKISFVAPIGISFYTLQLIAYLADVYNEKIIPQKNILKYALYASFFPQIFQGPIPRYDQLQEQLSKGHPLNEDEFIKGIYLIIWGFFLKFVIADKASIIVNQVFNNHKVYTGLFIWIASVLYSIQLYADFLACTTLAQGIARLYGIHLAENFCRPYFSASIKDFWRRWHISLSSWLRDYIYIPLGGNRKGKGIQYINLVITFLVSGFWHGVGIKFIIWGGNSCCLPNYCGSFSKT